MTRPKTPKWSDAKNHDLKSRLMFKIGIETGWADKVAMRWSATFSSKHVLMAYVVNVALSDIHFHPFQMSSAEVIA